MYDFRSVIPAPVHGMILENVLILMNSAAREILKSTVSFLISLTKTLNKDDLAPHVERIITAVVNWKPETRNPFRLKVRRLLERFDAVFRPQGFLKKLECSPISKFLSVKMVWSSPLKHMPNICFNGELHIILTLKNLEIGEHSSFFQLLAKLFLKSTLESRNIKITKVVLLVIHPPYKRTGDKLDRRPIFDNFWEILVFSRQFLGKFRRQKKNKIGQASVLSPVLLYGGGRMLSNF